MKKLSRWIAILLVILSLASCTWNMREVGTVRSVDNYHLPSEEFAASHLKPDDKVLIMEAANELRLFVQRTDVNRLEEFFCASK